MLFNSFEFLFFFPVVVFVFYVLPHRFRWLWLLLASYYFYMSMEPALILLLIASTILDYYCGRQMHLKQDNRIRKRYLWMSIIGNLGMLFFFKYFVFFTNSSQAIMEFFGIDWLGGGGEENYVFNKILLPVGISFYTFQTLSYSIDVYRREVIPERHFGRYALYVAFFPQLVAGPIERASRLLPQFRKEVFIDLKRIKWGIVMMAWGFFLKLVVADRIGVYVDAVFLDPSAHRGLPLFIGSLFFAFQIYFDFSAYCTIAIGAAKVLGYDLMQNFNRPFFFSSVRDFWRRWHISLMLWLKDYLYKPLIAKFGLNKIVAVLIVFFFNGLWHGANWTFVVWGLLCGVLMIIEVGTQPFRYAVLRKLGISLQNPVLRFVTWLTIFLSITTTLVFFRSPNILHALLYIKNMFSLNSTFVNVTYDRTELWLSMVLILLVQIIHYFKGNDDIPELVLNRKPVLRWGFYIAFIFMIVLFSVNRQNNFIYFQF